MGAYRGEYCFHTQIPAFIDWLCFIVRQLPSSVVRDNDNDKCYHTHVSAPDLAMGPSIYARKPKPKDVGALSSYAGVKEQKNKTRGYLHRHNDSPSVGSRYMSHLDRRYESCLVTLCIQIAVCTRGIATHAQARRVQQ